MTEDLNTKRAKLIEDAKNAGGALDAATLTGIFAEYDEFLENGIIDTQLADETGDTEISAFTTAATALTRVTHDHMRRRVYKALGVLMLEPQPRPIDLLLEQLAPALPQILTMALGGVGPGAGPSPQIIDDVSHPPLPIAASIVRGEPGHLWIVYSDGRRSVELDEATAEKLGFPVA